MFGIYSMVFLALLGVLLNYCEIPGTPFMLSFVLGSMIETYRASRSAAFHPKAVRGHFGNPALASR